MKINLNPGKNKEVECIVLNHQTRGRMYLFTSNSDFLILIYRDSDSFESIVNAEIHFISDHFQISETMFTETLTDEMISELKQMFKQVRNLSIVKNCTLYYYYDIDGHRHYHDDDFEYKISSKIEVDDRSFVRITDEAREVVDRIELFESLPVDGTISVSYKRFKMDLRYLKQFEPILSFIHPDPSYRVEFGIYISNEVGIDKNQFPDINLTKSYILQIPEIDLNEATKKLKELHSQLNSVCQNIVDGSYCVPTSTCVIAFCDGERYIVEKGRVKKFDSKLLKIGKIYPMNLTKESEDRQRLVKDLLKRIIELYTEGLIHNVDISIVDTKIIRYYSDIDPSGLIFGITKIRFDSKIYLMVVQIPHNNTETISVTSDLIEIREEANLLDIASSSTVFDILSFSSTATQTDKDRLVKLKTDHYYFKEESSLLSLGGVVKDYLRKRFTKSSANPRQIMKHRKHRSPIIYDKPTMLKKCISVLLDK